jgi:hypothetical protein
VNPAVEESPEKTGASCYIFYTYKENELFKINELYKEKK